MKIIIVGAGIGGLCLAQGLKKTGFEFVVYERNSDSEKWLEGYRLHINPMGSSSLHHCLPDNLWKAFLAGTADKQDGFGFLTEQMKKLVLIDENMMIGGKTEPEKGQYAISRIILRKILMSGIEDNISFGKSFNRFEQHPDGRVKVYFDDGASDIADLLVGADGANSKIRTQYLPNARRVETDAIAIGGRTLLDDESRKWISDSFKSRMNVIIPRDKFFFFNAAFDHKKKAEKEMSQIKKAALNANLNPDDFFDGDQNYILWAFIAHKKEFSSVSEGEDLRKVVLDKIDHWHSDIKRLVSAADVRSLVMLPLKKMLPIGQWKTTSVTILGDAVHNMPPLYGNGANTALFDAKLLTLKLNEVRIANKPLMSAVNEFEKIMLENGFKAVNLAVKYTDDAISENKLARFVNRSWLRLCSRFYTLKKMSFGSTWTDNT